ncbi:plasmid stabilization system protein [Chryseobacterium glaciei]|uniref:Plasmid stabilization system protein n=1 Tax=Chryseobacterium glaciei TaxID=1685010 RepID=A0A172XWZ6_9FLAO|nr:type II toxin-antitoxin system RelE/ParE family toxin [Chryseobacterium glaciei]ANF51426.1 plasmid stabilization system protein [Chryseobacterium glaciei]
MNYKLIIKPEAENDLDEAIEWYKEQNENLPEQLLNEVETGLNKIQKYPEHYQKRYKEIRITFTKKFPYGIYYTVENEIIFVHAILHNKQNPKNINKRTK